MSVKKACMCAQTQQSKHNFTHPPCSSLECAITMWAIQPSHPQSADDRLVAANTHQSVSAHVLIRAPPRTHCDASQGKRATARVREYTRTDLEA